MHVKKDDVDGYSFDFLAWCGVRVGGFTRAYLTVDDVLKAIRFKRGAYPCQDCLLAILEVVQDGVA